MVVQSQVQGIQRVVFISISAFLVKSLISEYYHNFRNEYDAHEDQCLNLINKNTKTSRKNNNLSHLKQFQKY